MIDTRVLAALVVAFAFVCPVADTAGAQEGHSEESLEDFYSEAELEAVYRSLPERQRKLLDEYATAKQRRRYLAALRRIQDEKRSDAELDRRIAEAKARAAKPEPPARYEMDPMLRKAYEYWADWKNRHRDVSIRLFQDYIDKNPESPFLTDIYFNIGALYSIHINRRFNEKKDMDLAMEYYRKAHKGYGRKWAPRNSSAWAGLAYDSRDMTKVREYYDWLRYLEKDGTIDDIYPFNGIGQCTEWRPPERSKEEKLVCLGNMKETIAGAINIAERNMFAMASPVDLAVFVSDYPVTQLAKQSKYALKSLAADAAAGALEILDVPIEEDIVTAEDIEMFPESESAGSAASPPAEEKAPPSGAPRRDAPEPMRRRLGLWLVAALAGVAAVVAVVAIVTRRRK